MEILLIDDCREWGGAEVCFENYFNALAQEHKVMALVDKGASSRLSITPVEKIGMPSHRYGLGGLFKEMPQLLKCFLRIFGVCRKFRPQVFICNDYLALFHALPAKWFWGIPVIFVAHNTDIVRPNPKLAKLFSCADGILAVGPSVCKQFEGYRGRLGIVQSPIIDLGYPLSPESDAPPRFVCVARLCAQKRQDLLIQGFSKIVGESDAVLELYGDGEWREMLETLVKTLGLEKRVFFKGFAKEPWRASQGAIAFVLVSDNEGAPLSIGEAQLAGIPVLGRALPSITDMISDGETGWLVSDNAPETIAEGLRRVLRTDRTQRERIVRTAHRAAALRHSPLVFKTELLRFVSQVADVQPQS